MADQLKKRVSSDVRKHYGDIWDELNVANDLAKKGNKFEAVRKDHRKCEPRNFGRIQFKKEHKYGQNQTKVDKGQNPKQRKARKLPRKN